MIWGIIHFTRSMVFQLKSNLRIISKYLRDRGFQSSLFNCNKPSIITRVVSKQLSPSVGHMREDE